MQVNALTVPPALHNLASKATLQSRWASATPRFYKAGCMKCTREIIVRANYVMSYRVDGETVGILRVLRAAQQWPSAGANEDKRK
jgi:toxin ParE1/3/4